MCFMMHELKAGSRPQVEGSCWNSRLESRISTLYSSTGRPPSYSGSAQLMIIAQCYSGMAWSPGMGSDEGIVSGIVERSLARNSFSLPSSAHSLMALILISVTRPSM